MLYWLFPETAFEGQTQPRGHRMLTKNKEQAKTHVDWYRDLEGTRIYIAGTSLENLLGNHIVIQSPPPLLLYLAGAGH